MLWNSINSRNHFNCLAQVYKNIAALLYFKQHVDKKKLLVLHSISVMLAVVANLSSKNNEEPTIQRLRKV